MLDLGPAGGRAVNGPLGIVSGSPGWHVRDLERAATDLGLAVHWIDFHAVEAGVPNLPPPAAQLLVRTMPSGLLEQIVFRLSWLHHWEQRGVRVCNAPAALEVCVDKFATSSRLTAAGLPTPRTRVSQTARQALAHFAELGSDVVVKPLFGSEGRGMMRITDPELMWRTATTLEQLRAVLYVQEFIRHPGWDLRLLVLAGTVLGGMRRVGRDGAWRTNVAQGAASEAWKVSDPERHLALVAAAAVGATFVGVDLLRDEQGRWWVIEVNGVPGWRAFAAATGIDVAQKLLRHLAGP